MKLERDTTHHMGDVSTLQRPPKSVSGACPAPGDPPSLRILMAERALECRGLRFRALRESRAVPRFEKDQAMPCLVLGIATEHS